MRRSNCMSSQRTPSVGEKVVFVGPAIDAVLASAAIPGVFPAVEWEARLLIEEDR